MRPFPIKKNALLNNTAIYVSSELLQIQSDFDSVIFEDRLCVEGRVPRSLVREQYVVHLPELVLEPGSFS